MTFDEFIKSFTVDWLLELENTLNNICEDNTNINTLVCTGSYDLAEDMTKLTTEQYIIKESDYNKLDENEIPDPLELAQKSMISEDNLLKLLPEQDNYEIISQAVASLGQDEENERTLKIKAIFFVNNPDKKEEHSDTNSKNKE